MKIHTDIKATFAPYIITKITQPRGEHSFSTKDTRMANWLSARDAPYHQRNSELSLQQLQPWHYANVSEEAWPSLSGSASVAAATGYCG